MVSARTFLTIGVILAGVALFFGLGGAQGIGARIGGGFKSFGSSFVGGLGGAFGNAFGETPDAPADPLKPNASLTGQGTDIGLPLLNENLQKTSDTLGGINNFFSNIFSGAIFNPSAFNPASSFTPSAIQNRMEFSSIVQQKQRDNFGGFQSANEQEIALQNAIIESQKRNPSFFLR